VTAVQAVRYADVGDAAPARSAIDVLARGDFAAVPLDDEWLMTTGLLADACATLGYSDLAPALYAGLQPYAHRVLAAPIEIALGSAARPVGKLAATLRRTDEAAH